MLNALLLSAYAAPLPVTTTGPRKLQGGVSVSFTCADVAGRTNLINAGAYCYMLDDSHPGTLSSVSSATGGGASCSDYYISVPGTPGANRLCYLDGSKCKASEAVTDCANTPPAAPSPPTLPQFGGMGRTDLKAITTEEVWCYMLDDSHPTVRDRYGACETYFYTDPKYPGQVNFCRLDGSKCKASPTWTTVANAPPTPPRPAPSPPPLITRCTDDPSYQDVW